jgi:ABC-type nitrate/sulfonate/bicarbonate transport system ATPase subunit
METEENLPFLKMHLSVSKKENFVVILGHSGCGKSTIMNILAGLAEPTEGAVVMDGQEVRGPSLDRGIVFQNYSLLPWLTTLKNVMFAVSARYPEWSKEQVEGHAIKFLSMVGLEGAVIIETQSIIRRNAAACIDCSCICKPSKASTTR